MPSSCLWDMTEMLLRNRNKGARQKDSIKTTQKLEEIKTEELKRKREFGPGQTTGASSNISLAASLVRHPYHTDHATRSAFCGYHRGF